MKKTVKVLSALLVLFSLTFMSCDPGEIIDPPPPDGNGNGEPCMKFESVNDLINGRISFVQFVNDNEGWMIGVNKGAIDTKVLIKTEDAGKTWAVINSDLTLNYHNGWYSGESIHFINSTDGFVSTGKYTIEEELELAYTTDKGATWTVIPSPFLFGDVVEKVDNWSKSFASNSTSTLIFGTSYYKVFVLKLDNATKAVTYSQIYNKDEYPVTIENTVGHPYHLADDGTITAVVYSLDANYSSVYTISQSTDNGATWTTKQELGDYEFKTASWPTNDVGYISGNTDDHENNVIFKTTDGGSTWTKIADTKDFEMIRFADENHGIAATSFDFFSTSDGGNTWVKMDCTQEDGQSFDGSLDEVMSYPSADNGWVAGSKCTNHLDCKQGIYHFEGQ